MIFLPLHQQCFNRATIKDTSILETFLSSTLYYIHLKHVIIDTATPPIQRLNEGSESLSAIEMEWQEQWSDRIQSRLRIFTLLRSLRSPEKIRRCKRVEFKVNAMF
ncbi:MAG: hypothetical protein HRU20_18430 [Pseudomonadales bacterium]|nr:hypothetical protein [Pseudomonadales bacterium]